MPLRLPNTIGSGRWLAVASAVGLMTFAGLAVETTRVAAHGVQVASEPPPNARLAEPPDTISVSFSEPIEPSVTTIHLWDTTPQETAE